MKKILFLFVTLFLLGCNKQETSLPYQDTASGAVSSGFIEETSPEIEPPSLNEAIKKLPVENTPEYLNIQKDGDNLVFEDILSENASYTRYQIHYQSEGYKISGIMNIPKGNGKYPLVILNHGYIDTSVYTNGRGLKREQDFLAKQGFAVLHTDYRNYAFSDTDSSLEGTGSILRSKRYGADAINAILAVQKAQQKNVPELMLVDTESVGMLGHSMGGGVTMFALVAAPELIDAAILYAPVHSQEWYNFEKWRKESLSISELQELETIYGDLGSKENFAKISPESYFQNIEAPVQMYFGTLDDSCPIAWGSDIETAFKNAGKEFEFIRYEGEGHELSRQFENFMQGSTVFFKKELQ